MQKYSMALAAVLVLGAGSMIRADDSQIQRRTTTQETYSNGLSTSTQASGTLPGNAMVQTSSAATPSPLAQRSVTTEETVMAQNNPPIRWNVLEGEVTHVDKVNNVVEIRLKGSRQTVGIPVVDKRVGIYRHGDHQYALKDIEPGDTITLRNLNTSASAL